MEKSSSTSTKRIIRSAPITTSSCARLRRERIASPYGSVLANGNIRATRTARGSAFGYSRHPRLPDSFRYLPLSRRADSPYQLQAAAKPAHQLIESVRAGSFAVFATRRKKREQRAQNGRSISALKAMVQIGLQPTQESTANS